MTRFRFRLDRWHLAALVLLALLAWLYTHRLATWLIDDDEEGYLYAAWRISQGQLPYRDFVTPQLPAFLYPGALLVALFGRDPWVMRLWSVGLALVAAGATYLTGRRLFGPVAGLVAMTTVFVIDDLFAVARAFRPEASMLAAGALALYLVVRGEGLGRRSSIPSLGRGREGDSAGIEAEPSSASLDASAGSGLGNRFSRRHYAAASLCFGIALLAKLFGLLPWAATAAYVLFDGLTGGRPRRRLIGDLAALILPGLLLVAGVMAAFLVFAPETVDDVFLHHVRQGAKLTRAEVVANALGFYVRTLHWHAAFIAFLPAGLVAARRLAPRRWALVAWQLPTLAAFLFLSRQLWARHLVYLLPAVGLLVGALAAWIWDRERTSDQGQSGDGRWLTALVVGGIAGALALPHLLEDWEGSGRAEVGTARIANLVQAFVEPQAQVLPDFPGIAFYAGRTTTKHAAGLSEGATESGQISGAILLDEMKRADVQMVLMDTFTQSGQLVDMADYDAFAAAVQADYTLLGRFWRFEQPFAVYVKAERIQKRLDFGWAELVAASAGRAEPIGGVLRREAEPGRPFVGGEAVAVNLVWRSKSGSERPLTAFVHLVGPDGEVWGQGDHLLDNALARSSEEWQEGEVVATPLDLTIPLGTPPGRYAVQVGLYDRGTGARLRFTDPGTDETGDSHEVGTIDIVAPEHPAFTGQADFGSTALTQALRAGPLSVVALGPMPGSVRAGDSFDVPVTVRFDSAPDQNQLGPLLTLSMASSAEQATPMAGEQPGRTEPLRPPSFLSSPNNIASANVDMAPLFLSFHRWFERGDVIRLRPRLVVSPESASGLATLRLAWMGDYRSIIGEPVALATIQIEALPPPMTSLPSEAVTRSLTFGTAPESVSLAGYLGPESLTPSTSLSFTLYWKATTPLTTSQTVFVHLVDGAGKVVAQADGLPADGTRPTTGWRAGEVVADSRSVMLPELPPGEYRLLVGLYDPRLPGMPRLPTSGPDGAPIADGRAEVRRFTVSAE